MSIDEPVRARQEEVAWRRVESEIVILDLRRSSYLTINVSGITLWERLQGDGATREELITALVEAFGISQETASVDVEGFITMLREKDLLR